MSQPGPQQQRLEMRGAVDLSSIARSSAAKYSSPDSSRMTSWPSCRRVFRLP